MLALFALGASSFLLHPGLPQFRSGSCHVATYIMLNVQYVKSLKKMLIIEISLAEIENMRISDLARCAAKEIPLYL